MFLGTYTPRLDDKGRLSLPAKFRDQLTEGLVVTRGQERCLTVWPRPAFEQVALQAQAAPVTDRAVRDYTRLLFAGASDDQPDKQGRLSIPPMLRDYASLTRDVVVIGVVNRLEIWDSSRWQSYSDTHEESFSDLGQEVFPRD
jgi:MraZ protein